MPLNSCEHEWRETGRHGVHCEFPTKTKGIRTLYVYYVHCDHCKQVGFRKPSRRVVYTWDPDPANWITE